MKTKYTRNELIAICEKAIVSHKNWDDRDSFSAHTKVGMCWALLKAGCKFEILHSTDPKERCSTDDHTIWVKMWAKTFSWFESGDEETNPDGFEHNNGGDLLFYLPTPKRLKEAGGNDWY